MLLLDGPGGAMVGVTTAHIVSPRVALSDETVVAARWQGVGLAPLLLDEMVRCLAGRGVERLVGRSSARRRRALRFFVRHGFEIVGVQRACGEPGFSDGQLIYITCLSILRFKLTIRGRARGRARR